MSKPIDVLFQLGNRIRELRKKKGYSQEAFADVCELDRTYVGGIERGERNVSFRNIHIIAVGLGISISELVEGIE